MSEVPHDQKAKLDQLAERAWQTIDQMRRSPAIYDVESPPFTSQSDLLIQNIQQWHRERNLIAGSTDKDQTLKLLQELGELSDSVCKGKDVSDDIGDMLVVMINIMVRNNLSMTDCLERAWNDIKDRKGKMVDGIFVKESDL